jgi:hypothetical protein
LFVAPRLLVLLWGGNHMRWSIVNTTKACGQSCLEFIVLELLSPSSLL